MGQQGPRCKLPQVMRAPRNEHPWAARSGGASCISRTSAPTAASDLSQCQELHMSSPSAKCTTARQAHSPHVPGADEPLLAKSCRVSSFISRFAKHVLERKREWLEL